MSQLKVNTIRHTSASSDAITLASDGTATAKITNIANGNRNLVINGAMQIAERQTSTTTTNQYVCDRFRWFFAGQDEAPTCAQVALTSSDTGPWAKGFRHALQITNGNQTGGAGATDECNIYHQIEAQNIAKSGWDYTSASSYITLSFWLKSSVAQNFYGYLATSDGSSQMYLYETGDCTANTWKKVTLKIPGNSNIQIDNNNEHGFAFSIAATWGSDYTVPSPTLNSWTAWNGSARAKDTPTTWWTTNDATFAITGVQLEVGDTATEFEHRTYGDELARCQRYFYKENVNDSVGPYFMQYHATHKFCHMWYPVTMRTTPTATVTYSSGSPSAYKITKNHFKAYVGSSSPDSTTSIYITAAQFDAEL